LLAFWRDNFDTTNEIWEEEWYRTVLGSRSYNDLLDYIKTFEIKHFYDIETVQKFSDWKIKNLDENFFLMPVPKQI
jgi:hypothetical protein